MKFLFKIMIVALILTGTFQALNAQVRVGVRGGFNYATAKFQEKIDGEWDNETPDYLFGAQAGLLAEFNFAGKFAIQPELTFIQKGFRTQGPFDNFNPQITSVFNYVEVPVLFKGKFGQGRVKFNALAGPSLGYALNGKVKSDLADADIDFDQAEIKRWDFGAMVGVGASVDAGPGALFLDTRFGWGFSNLVDSADSDNNHWHTRGFNVGLGYILALSNK